MGPRFTTNLIQIAAGVIVYFGLLTLMKDDFHMNLIRKVLNHRKGEAAMSKVSVVVPVYNVEDYLEKCLVP